MREVVVPGELDQPPHGRHGLEVGEAQLRLLGPDVAVGLFQHGLEQAFLVLEVVIDQPLVQRGALGDAVHRAPPRPYSANSSRGRR
jgi:hypothetical protein